MLNYMLLLCAAVGRIQKDSTVSTLGLAQDEQEQADKAH